MFSKTKIDKAGEILSKNVVTDEVRYIEAEDVFNEYRGLHLAPLMQTTMMLQNWMDQSGKGYYIAMRLKRRPQILRKLRRLHVRLSQLQDIAGARIILDANQDVDEAVRYLQKMISQQKDISLVRDVDYRMKGRDDSGYRARHIVLAKDGYKIELQLRSRIQHYWAETIERTSVVYGHFLKELDGDDRVLDYFKQLSDVLYEFEANRKPTTPQRLRLDRLHSVALAVIQTSDSRNILVSHPDKNVLKTLTEISANAQDVRLDNWILIFDWNTGGFVQWLKASHDPKEAIALYSNNEKDYSAEDGFEVVLVGASDPSTIENTHSHYFGIESYDGVLKSIDDTFDSIEREALLSIDERRIVSALYTRKFWGGRTMSLSTIKNHLCEGIGDFDSVVEGLIRKGLLIRGSNVGPVSLNVDKKVEIDKLMA